MPRRNVIKPRLPNTSYHVWNRGIRRRTIFRDAADKRYFISLLCRYLSTVEHYDRQGRAYARLRGKLRLLTFCLMGNHFHLVLHNIDRDGIERLMRRVVRAYVGYFNSKYGESGALFPGPYRARVLRTRGETRTAIAYVHDNHGPDCRCEFCGGRFFAASALDAPTWIDVARGLEIFGSAAEYRHFRNGRATMKSLTA